jgi:ABC-type multidrug transport system fused ATPase/permease subunit
MYNLLRALFEDFIRVFSVLDRHEKFKTFRLFLLLGLQILLELFFILALTYIGTALTNSDVLRASFVFKSIFFVFPWLDSWVIEPRRFVFLAGIVVAITSVCKNIVNYLTSKYTILLGEGISIKIGAEIMSRFLYRDYTWHLSPESGDTFQRMMWRNNLASMLISLLSMYASILTLLFLFFSLVGQQPVLTTIVISIVGLVGFVLYKSIRHNVDAQAKLSAECSRQETQALLCATKGIRDVLIYGQQEVFLKGIMDAAKKGIWPRAFSMLAPTMPTWVLETTGFLVVVVSVGYLVFVSDASIPELTAALGLLMLTAWRVLPYANRIVSFQVAIRALRPTTLRVLELLEDLRRNPTDPPPDPDPNFSFSHVITLRNVSFRYPGVEIDRLNAVSVDIPLGHKLGVIGPSGAGKSTLVGVLCGLLRPSSGELLVDGEPLTPPRAAAYSKLIGYVPQAPFLFAGTLGDNVAFSQWGRAWEEGPVREACRKAAIDFVDSHPSGLKLPIGENGGGLSGGQAQRVSIARAMFTRPLLLVFDEATSALDQANENSILQTIMDLADEVTCVIIAHRLTSVEQCDSLIWMEAGRIVMQGAPEEVLPLYRQSQEFRGKLKGNSENMTIY